MPSVFSDCLCLKIQFILVSLLIFKWSLVPVFCFVLEVKFLSNSLTYILILGRYTTNVLSIDFIFLGYLDFRILIFVYTLSFCDWFSIDDVNVFYCLE